MTNDELVNNVIDLVIKIDPKSKNLFINKYCGYCGRYLYCDELISCKKCKTSVESAIDYAIPLIKSPTAFEKLVVWFKDLSIDSTSFRDTLRLIKDSYIDFIDGNYDANKYKYRVVNYIYTYLITYHS